MTADARRRGELKFRDAIRIVVAKNEPERERRADRYDFRFDEIAAVNQGFDADVAAESDGPVSPGQFIMRIRKNSDAHSVARRGQS